MSDGRNKCVGLHKFTTIDTLYKILQPNNGFRFSSIKDLNDVFESADIKNESLYILSFSKSYDNLLMWAHYANKHMGCSIKVDYNNSIEFEEVKYKTREERKQCKTDRERLCIKGRRWEYENEYRIILDTKEKLPEGVFSRMNNNEEIEYFLMPSIKEIAFGCNIQDSYEYLQILRILKDINDEARRKSKRTKKDIIQVKKYKIKESDFSLTWDEYEYEEEIKRLELKEQGGTLQKLMSYACKNRGEVNCMKCKCCIARNHQI